MYLKCYLDIYQQYILKVFSDKHRFEEKNIYSVNNENAHQETQKFEIRKYLLKGRKNGIVMNFHESLLVVQCFISQNSYPEAT